MEEGGSDSKTRATRGGQQGSCRGVDRVVVRLPPSCGCTGVWVRAAACRSTCFAAQVPVGQQLDTLLSVPRVLSAPPHVLPCPLTATQQRIRVELFSQWQRLCCPLPSPLTALTRAPSPPSCGALRCGSPYVGGGGGAT